MKANLLFFLSCFLLQVWSAAQELPTTNQEQMEAVAMTSEGEMEDDGFLQQLHHYRKHPMNLNEANESDLRELVFLTDLQIHNIISYRRLLGSFLSIYELQAVPGLDLVTIRKVLPFVTVEAPVLAREDIHQRFSAGDHSLLDRFSQTLERSKGFDKHASGSTYLGSRAKLFFRYRYQYKNLLQFGVVGDKDAGEQFFKGAQKTGFDFYSFHLFARRVGKIEAIALGDFTVNLGQGLIQWQSLAFKKSAEVGAVKRQSPVLRPYNSAGEFSFYRGAGITIKMKRTDATAFLSMRKLSANLVIDSLTNEEHISSILTSGYHRSSSEIDDRNNLSQLAFGGNFSYHFKNGHAGINAVGYHFSLPIEKRDEPYNSWAITGKSWSNVSIDYSWTHRNIHLFGEAAIDKNMNKAIVNGILIAVDRRLDLVVFERNISSRYESVNGNAFTENSSPTNEHGLYTAVTVRPATGWQVDAYADIYRFPFLKYLVDAPGCGKDFLVRLTYSPNKKLEIYSRFKAEAKQENQPGNLTATNYLIMVQRQDWRIQFSSQFSSSITIRSRVELLWYNKRMEDAQTGFLGFVEVISKPHGRYTWNFRWQYFETGSYDSRIYSYESDVLYGYSIPAFYGKGSRYYVNLNFDAAKNLSLWLRWAQTVYINAKTIGSGLDEIPGNKKSEIRFQAIWTF